MCIGIVANDTSTIFRECPGPQAAGTCPIVDPQNTRLPCAGQHLLLKLGVVAKPKTWMFRVAPDINDCPVYLIGE